MSGLTGIYSEEMKSAEKKKLIDVMISDITYNPEDAVDRWIKGALAAARVHHNVVNKEEQPIFNEDESLCIFMDGEIYDYESQKRLLERKGHRFRFSNNDAEYCLHLYEEFGDDAFRKLNGNFQIVIYNLKSGELILVTDRYSTRRIAYFHDGSNFVFSIQLRALMRYEKLPVNLETLSIIEFCSIQKVLGGKTYLKDVFFLDSGSVLHYKNGEIRINKYWEAEFDISYRPESYFVDSLISALTEAVDRRTRDNPRHGILLSGGLDSRVLLAADRRKKMKTAFTLGNFMNRETRIAMKVAEVGGCRHVFLKRNLEHYIDILDRAVDIGDGMYRYDHAHFLGLYDDFKKYADILFIGYAFNLMLRGEYMLHRILSIGGKDIVLPLPMVVPESINFSDIPWFKFTEAPVNDDISMLFNPALDIDFKDVLNSAGEELLSEVTLPGARKSFDYMSRSPAFEHGALQNIISLQSYIDVRILILDNDLHELIFTIPPILRINGRIFRKVLKRLSPELSSIPNSGSNLKINTPFWIEWLIKNSKKGLTKSGFMHEPELPHPALTQKSWPNKARLLIYNDELRNLMWSTINDPDSLNPEIFNIDKLRNMFHQHLKRREDYSGYFYCLLTFGRWHKKYVA